MGHLLTSVTQCCAEFSVLIATTLAGALPCNVAMVAGHLLVITNHESASGRSFHMLHMTELHHLLPGHQDISGSTIKWTHV